MTRPVHPPSAELTDRLIAAGALRADDPPTEALRRVDRGVFVPSFAVYEHTSAGTRYRLIRRDDPGLHTEWAEHVYADETLIIEIKGEPVAEALPGGTGKGRWTSSSTMPSLVAQMLTELDPAPGARVLEIGTGSGYNAALLCEILGSEQVASIDISPRLVSDAEERLASLGYRPVLAAADGHQGHPGGAPYDRIIATTAFTHVPPAWLKQIRPGGTILVNLAGGIGGAMLKLRAGGDGTAQGRFLPQWAGFMPARGHGPRNRVSVDDDGEEGSTALGPAALREPASAFLAQLATTDAAAVERTAEDGTDFLFLEAADGAWAEVDIEPEGGGHRVLQGGPRKLWSAVEEAHRWWEAEGRPDWSAFGATAAPEGQYVWYRSPEDGRRWPLPG